ncbi:RNA chaperone Hfq [Sphingomonas ginkgonis]|uniref:RNA-binding protein Hfq n=1 Tax=Sphingomonas ginkgonis TaxID=2315330 RepID=A0A3R9WP88_9SPHN|nr:RNA chaperone Hfq [Sphingomonas ginkgonis]RST31105.1 RNA chaperone Hfq [Sphingomonas ginkgonis]
MSNKPFNLQDHFLNSMRRQKIPATVFLIKGVKLQGIVTWFDTFSLLLRREGTAQLVYKHAISTIMPAAPVDGLELPPPEGEGKGLQDIFLTAARREQEPMVLYLVNGVMLQGEVAGFDQFSLLLERHRQTQLVYKHAISTLQPMGHLNLGPSEPAEEE